MNWIGLRYLCQNVPINKSKILAYFNDNQPKPLYDKDPNADWMSSKIQELTSDSTSDEPTVVGKKNGIMFLI